MKTPYSSAHQSLYKKLHCVNKFRLPCRPQNFKHEKTIGLFTGNYCWVLSACNTTAEQKQQQKFIITGYMDSSIQPGDNFYKFVNGKWLDTVQIPSTEIGTGSFLDLRVKTRSNLKTLIEEVSKASNTAGSNEQKVGDFYLSGMDTAAIDKLGYEPVKPYLQKIDAITDTKGILQFVAEQQMENTPLLFSTVYCRR